MATLVSSCPCWEMDGYLSSSNVGRGRDTLGRRRLNILEQSDSAICISLGFFSKYGQKTGKGTSIQVVSFLTDHLIFDSFLIFKEVKPYQA